MNNVPSLPIGNEPDLTYRSSLPKGHADGGVAGVDLQDDPGHDQEDSGGQAVPRRLAAEGAGEARDSLDEYRQDAVGGPGSR